MKIKIEDIMFWILILAAIAVILWLLNSSPTSESALISIGLFIISSEIFLWKKYFEVDKKMVVSFIKIKNDLGNMKNDLNNLKKGQEEMNNKLSNIENILK